MTTSRSRSRAAGRLRLPTLAEVSRTRRAQPKGQIKTQLAEKVAAMRADEKATAAFRAAVWKRDGGRCRVCGVQVKKTLALDPKRGEVHHRMPRSTKPERRYDVANGLLVCLQCHQRITKKEIPCPS